MVLALCQAAFADLIHLAAEIGTAILQIPSEENEAQRVSGEKMAQSVKVLATNPDNPS